MLLFKDIKQNYPAYILDTQEFSLIQGKATQVSFPRLEMNQKTGKTEMVVESRIATPHGEHKVKFNLPYEQTANALMSAKGYSEYVKKHGYHFTDALAEHVSKMMENANGQQHTWTASQVKKSMESLGLSIPDKVTTGDVTYVANMAYADFYPDPLKDEAACLRYAHKVANDPDGYDGMIFCRWTADAIGKAIKLDWEKFV